MIAVEFFSFRLLRVAGSPASAEPAGRLGELERSARCDPPWISMESMLPLQANLNYRTFVSWVDFVCLYQKRQQTKSGKLSLFEFAGLICCNPPFGNQKGVTGQVIYLLMRSITRLSVSSLPFFHTFCTFFHIIPLETTIVGIPPKNWTQRPGSGLPTGLGHQ